MEFLRETIKTSQFFPNGKCQWIDNGLYVTFLWWNRIHLIGKITNCFQIFSRGSFAKTPCTWTAYTREIVSSRRWNFGIWSDLYFGPDALRERIRIGLVFTVGPGQRLDKLIRSRYKNTDNVPRLSALVPYIYGLVFFSPSLSPVEGFVRAEFAPLVFLGRTGSKVMYTIVTAIDAVASPAPRPWRTLMDVCKKPRVTNGLLFLFCGRPRKQRSNAYRCLKKKRDTIFLYLPP